MPVVLQAQKYEKANRVQAIVHKIIIPEDGTLEEALATTQEWTEKVLRQNPNFESIELLLEETAADTVDLLVLYRMQLDPPEKDTNAINQELIQKHWPGDGEFNAFIARLRKYINPALNERKIYHRLVLK